MAKASPHEQESLPGQAAMPEQGLLPEPVEMQGMKLAMPEPHSPEVHPRSPCLPLHDACSLHFLNHEQGLWVQLEHEVEATVQHPEICVA